ncbi:MAG: 6-bladed beta-propeller [Gemmatimonadota bacterium]
MIPDPVSCAQCRIRLELQAIIGDTEGQGAIDHRPSLITMDRRGRIFVVVNREAPQVFDTAGRFVQRLGRPGRGPGEFSIVDAIVPIESDSFLVFDAGLLRVSTYSPDLMYVRSHHREPRRIDAALRLVGGESVVAASFPSRQSAGYPLHIVSDSGRVLKSFGVSRPELRPEFPDINRRLLAPAAAGEFWSVKLLKYELELWDRSGAQRDALQRNAPWFVASIDGPVIVTPEQPPPSVLLGLREAEDGLLWVSLGRAAPAWRSALGERRRSPNGFHYYEIVDVERLNESWIEVIDPTAGRVVSRARTAPVRVGWVVGHLLASYGEDSSGVGRVSLWRTRLEKPY